MKFKMTKAQKALENKLVALIKKHGKVRVVTGMRGKKVLGGYTPTPRDRILYKTGLCTYRLVDVFNAAGRKKSCFNKSRSMHCLDWVKDPVRRAVRSMIGYDRDFRKIAAIYIGRKLDKVVK